MLEALGSVEGEFGKGVFGEFNCLADGQTLATPKWDYAVRSYRFQVGLCIGIVGEKSGFN